MVLGSGLVGMGLPGFGRGLKTGAFSGSCFGGGGLFGLGGVGRGNLFGPGVNIGIFGRFQYFGDGHHLPLLGPGRTLNFGGGLCGIFGLGEGIFVSIFGGRDLGRLGIGYGSVGKFGIGGHFGIGEGLGGILGFGGGCIGQ